MIEEIEAAVNFLMRLISKSDSLDDQKIQQLANKFCQLLKQRFRDHWFPEDASRGQAYRCIRINELDRREPSLEQACVELSINYEDLKLPIELTIWVDPGEVACRFGEHKGSYCIVAKFHEGTQENYIDQINVEELEQRSLERNKQATFTIHKKTRNSVQNGRLKNGYNNLNGYSNGYHTNDYQTVIPTTSSPSSAYSAYYYSNGSPYSFQNSPPTPHSMYNNQKYPTLSPSQTRSLTNTPFRTGPGGGKLNGINGYNGQNNGTMSANGTKFARNLNSSFNNVGLGPLYPHDRYNSHYNKSINGPINQVKA